MYKCLMFAALMVAAGSAVANDTGTRVDVEAKFAAQREAIFKELKGGETYSEISPVDRKKVRIALERISATLERAGGVANLDEQEKVDVFNNQELVNAILTQAGEDSRLVCRREGKVGTRFTVNVCLTAKERARATEASREVMGDLRRNRLHGEGG